MVMVIVDCRAWSRRVKTGLARVRDQTSHKFESSRLFESSTPSVPKKIVKSAGQTVH
jgi:hypothetical protein